MTRYDAAISCRERRAARRGATLEVRLNPDGSLAQAKVLSQRPNSTAVQAALRAVGDCAPFRVPAEFANRYADWQVMIIQFDTI
jgi:colicin import membrane protein